MRSRISSACCIVLCLSRDHAIKCSRLAQSLPSAISIVIPIPPHKSLQPILHLCSRLESHIRNQFIHIHECLSVAGEVGLRLRSAHGCLAVVCESTTYPRPELSLLLTQQKTIQIIHCYLQPNRFEHEVLPTHITLHLPLCAFAVHFNGWKVLRTQHIFLQRRQ